MGRRRKVEIQSTEGTGIKISERALRKLILFYYKGPHDFVVKWDNRIAAWGDHSWDKESKTHIIRLSPNWCTYNKLDNEVRDFEALTGTYGLTKMTPWDSVARIVHTLLHEIVHANQADSPISNYFYSWAGNNPSLKNAKLSYELSLIEAEAEGKALLRFHRAMELYEKWTR